MEHSIGRMFVIALVLGLLSMHTAYPADVLLSFEDKVSTSTTEYKALVDRYNLVMQKDMYAVGTSELQELVVSFAKVKQTFEENLSIAVPIFEAMRSNRDKVSDQLKGVTNVLLKDRLEAMIKDIDVQIVALNTGVAVVESSLAEVDDYIGTLTVFSETLRMIMDQEPIFEVIKSGVQETVADSTKVGTLKAVKFSIPLTYVEGGTFQMGSTTGDSDESAVHMVTVGSFYMGTYEVTQDIYQQVMGSNPSKWKRARLPVETVNWYDAVAFCNALSRWDGLEEVYTINRTTVSCDWSKKGYRLPTEAEWEYAARGGNVSKGYKYAGSDNWGDVWHARNGDFWKTNEVGLKIANELGLYDMSGNVCEWCWDWYGDYLVSNQTNPKGASKGSRRVIRGGSGSAGFLRVGDFNGESTDSRVANRYKYGPAVKNPDIGFRVLVPVV
ncbi:MAG: hypothetical protein CVV52_03995 [Spirochaetae bacterium HGW-Spirochaetae-8]|nr:MAG: hypothetical protein CVV52_03995 [Spirochaetae bacterium HGW-Spirochaetae-8]